MMFDSARTFLAQKIEPETIFVDLNFLQEILTEPGQLQVADGAFKE